MAYDKKLIAGKLRRWEKFLKNYSLPAWREIPNFGLYMEQVIAIVKQYLDYLPPELKDDEIITAAAINNYVRKHVMPEPVKKKYYRVHIAYLLMICSLKRSISIASIQKIIPSVLSEEELETAYSSYVNRVGWAAGFFIEQMRLEAGNILDHENVPDNAAHDTSDLVMDAAIYGGFARLLAEKLILLNDKTIEDVPIDPE